MNTIAAIKRGDEFIFEQVFNEYHEKLYFYILHKTGSRYMAEETTQLAFIKLWQYRGSLDENIDLSIQLFRIAKTTFIDLLRKQALDCKVRKTITINHTEEIPWGTAEKMDEKELHEKIYRAIREMPSARRRVFEMSRIQGKSYKEIATELTLSIKTVENHIAHALKQLRHLLLSLLLFIFLLLGF